MNGIPSKTMRAELTEFVGGGAAAIRAGWETIWPIRTAILTALHIVSASAVSVHVLLRKRDIGAAVGWIGLGWLSPFLGAGLYLMFGINRVRRRAHGLRSDLPHMPAPAEQATEIARGDNFAALERAALWISRRPATIGNSATLLQNGDEAYPRMIATIDAAQTSILLSSYILRDDAAGAPFIDALVRAHARGVEARVLLDGIGSGYFRSPSYSRLRRNGVPAARFMHSSKPWLMPFLNLRSHKKVVVADGRSAFIGGLNIGAENLLAGHPRHPVRDVHFELHGPVVGQLVADFARDWLFTTGETLEGSAWFPELKNTGNCVARVVTSGPDRDVDKIELLALTAITCARTSVRIMSPYFLPDDRLVSALALAAMRGVEVDILIPERSNHRFVDLATRPNIEPMIRAGCRIWLNPPPFEHSKLMVVDNAWAMIGSANWDMRSFRLNFEVNLEIFDVELAQILEHRMLDKQLCALTLNELVATPLAARLRNAGLRLLLPYL